MDLRGTARDVIDGFARHRLLTYASAISYQLISSVVPFALFALGVMGMLNLEDRWTNDLSPKLAGQVSFEVWSLVNQTVLRIFAHRQLFWVTFGLVLVLWELSGAIRATMEALDDVYGTDGERSRLDRYATSVALAAGVGALVLATGAVLVAGHVLLGGAASVVVRYLLAALLLTVAVGIVLRVAPAERQPVAWVSGGSAVIVVGWLVVVGGYVLYATRIASYGSVFGSLAAVFVFVVCVYLSAIVFLTGALLDALGRNSQR